MPATVQYTRHRFVCVCNSRCVCHKSNVQVMCVPVVEVVVVVVVSAALGRGAGGLLLLLVR